MKKKITMKDLNKLRDEFKAAADDFLYNGGSWEKSQQCYKAYMEASETFRKQ